MINTASKLYDKLLNVYTTQHDILSEDQQKRLNVLNRSENLTLGFDENDLPPRSKIRARRNYCWKSKIKCTKKNSNKTGAQLKILTHKKLVTWLITSTVSTSKSWKQLKQIEKWNQTNTLSFVSIQ